MNEVNKETLIFTVIAAIPEGCVASYGQVAAMAGYPQNARLVGALLKGMPNDSSIPWHRVINSQGKISFPEGSSKHQEQKQRLQSEGVIFNKGRVNLKRYAWQD